MSNNGVEYGRNVIFIGGNQIRLSATDDTEWFPVGISVDWSKVAANNSDTVLPGGAIAPAGIKFIKLGTIMAQVTNPTVLHFNITGAPTGGYTVLNLAMDGGTAFPTGHIAYNADAAAVLAAVQAATGLGPTVSGSIGPGFDITFGTDFYQDHVFTATHTDSFTGGTAPAATVSVTNAGQAKTFYWAPADTTATDGRQTLHTESTCLIEQTVLQRPAFGAIGNPTNHPQVLNGGTVRKALLQCGLNNQPSLAALLAVMPRLKLVEEL